MTRTFNGIEDFYASVKGTVVLEPMFQALVNAYEGSIGGCKCTRRARKQVAKNHYLNLDQELTQEKLDAMKEHFKVDKFGFLVDGQLHMTIE